jgi:hypothetical protein
VNLITLKVPGMDMESVVSNHTFLEPHGWREVRDRRRENSRWYTNGNLFVAVSVQEEMDGRRWLHVSASCRDRVPNYAELTRIKREFIGPHRKALHIWPPEAEHISECPNCLHLWACLDQDLLPDFRRWDEDAKKWRI